MNIVRVLVVDDSAYVRKVVKQMLVRSPFIEVVGTARDGVEALEQVAELNPDVVTCDLNMPQMDGTDFVRAQMARRPVPIIIISVASHAGEAVLAALDAGAIDFVQKPTALATDKLLDIADQLVEKVKAAAQAPLRVGLPAAAVPEHRLHREGLAGDQLLALGGGVESDAGCRGQAGFGDVDLLRDQVRGRTLLGAVQIALGRP